LEFSRQIITTPLGAVEVLRRADGRNVRIGNGRRNRPVGRYASVKNGESRVWESRPELFDIYHAEVDPDVVAYTTQPETLRWQSNGRRRQYTPDRQDVLVNGHRYVEVKDVYDEDRDPEYAGKLAEACEIYRHMGCELSIRDRGAITAEPLFSAVEEIQSCRRAIVTPDHVLQAEHLLGEYGRQFADFADGLGSRATCLAMLVRRVIRIDLTHGLVDDAQVSLTRRL
jgi:hypothetical protein